MLLDLSFYGFGQAALKALKVFGWVALSGAVAALGMYLQNYTVDASNIILITIVGVVNAFLVFANKWLTAVNPMSVEKTVEV